MGTMDFGDERWPMKEFIGLWESIGEGVCLFSDELGAVGELLRI